jgi:hypothetical protein
VEAEPQIVAPSLTHWCKFVLLAASRPVPPRRHGQVRADDRPPFSRALRGGLFAAPLAAWAQPAVEVRDVGDLTAARGNPPSACDIGISRR